MATIDVLNQQSKESKTRPSIVKSEFCAAKGKLTPMLSLDLAIITMITKTAPKQFHSHIQHPFLQTPKTVHG